jgi:putative PIN family toxin of toxin-antitoxin system
VVDVVIDTVVFVRSLINPRSIWGELVFRRRGHYRLIMSQPILDEIIEVIQRPEIAKKFSSIADTGDASIREILEDAIQTEPASLAWSGRDPKDDVFIATAIAASAAYLISEDRDLLDLGSYEGINIIDTITFLRILDG